MDRPEPHVRQLEQARAALVEAEQAILDGEMQILEQRLGLYQVPEGVTRLGLVGLRRV